MKGYIKGKSIILIDSLPEEIKEGDEVNVSFSVIPKRKYSFPTFNLGVKDEYTQREKIYTNLDSYTRLEGRTNYETSFRYKLRI